jgi:NAD(P)H dehydrogenase (quinone)
MKIIITGATGNLGGLAVKHLLNKVSADQIAVVARDLKKAAPLAETGLEVRYGDYDDMESMEKAFAGGDKLLIVSSSSQDDTQRVLQHAKVVKAAANARIGHIAYTGYAFAEDSDLPLRFVHIATENAIRTTNIPYTFLRNCFYAELFVTSEIKAAVETGILTNNAGDGKINAVTRSDLALAAAVVLTGEGHENKTYNLTNSRLWSYTELAEAISQVSGKKIVYKAMSFEAYKETLIQSGLSELAAAITAGVYQSVLNGESAGFSGDLEKLIGSPTPLTDIVKEILRR